MSRDRRIVQIASSSLVASRASTTLRVASVEPACCRASRASRSRCSAGASIALSPIYRFAFCATTFCASRAASLMKIARLS